MRRADASVQLAAVGFRVFPVHYIPDALAGVCSCGNEHCQNQGKHPATQHGLKDATTDPTQVRFWWQVKPYNIGVATGSGLYVVDCDRDEGVGNWAELEREHGHVDTLCVRTGGGGMHVYFTQPEGITLRNTASKIAPAIDTRGDGGYVLAPPSNHKTGRVYEWANGSSGIAQVPGWLVAMLEPKQHTPKATPSYRIGSDTSPYGRAILHTSLGRVRRAPEGARNQTLAREAFILGQWIGGGEIAPEGVYEMLCDSSTDEDRRKTETTARHQLLEGTRYPRRKD